MSRPNRLLKIDVISDVAAGTIVAASNVALAAGFTAVVFQGELEAGFATAMWAILVSMIIVGVIVGVSTTLPPVVAGSPDTAVIAVLSLLANAIAVPMLANGVAIGTVVTHVLLAITLMTSVYGAILWLMGTLGWAKALRFVPYTLIGGFLAATGLLLIKQSLEIVLGEQIDFGSVLPLWTGGSAQLWWMAAFVGFLISAHHLVNSPLVMPLAFFAAVGACHCAILMGYVDGAEWFVSLSDGLKPWFPINAATSGQIDWMIIVDAIPEIAACIIVALVSLVVRVSTIEAMRKVSADIDHEFRFYGFANLVAAPAGAMSGGILFSSSRLIQLAGYRTPLCYFVTAALLFGIVFLGVDLSVLLPKPVLGGLLLYLGYTMAFEALRVALRHRSLLERLLTVVILFLCLQFGFVVGAAFGVIAACLIFAFDCSRTGVIRRHLTRSEISGGTEWPWDIESRIRAYGQSIHIYELSGYVFFGSSEDLFDDIRKRTMDQIEHPIRFIVFDVARVSGHDSSALNTLIKLQGFAEKNGIKVAYCGLSPSYLTAFEKAGIITDNGGAASFATRLEAQHWCDDQLLKTLPANLGAKADVGFLEWIAKELGTSLDAAFISDYFIERKFEAGEVVYMQGEDADTIDFIVSGSVVMSLQTDAETHMVRRSTRRTVIGEMGLFRHAPRSVSIFAAERLVMYSLSRDRLDELELTEPALHSKLLFFIIRVLADRVDMANREISVLR